MESIINNNNINNNNISNNNNNININHNTISSNNNNNNINPFNNIQADILCNTDDSGNFVDFSKLYNIYNDRCQQEYKNKLNHRVNKDNKSEKCKKYNDYYIDDKNIHMHTNYPI